jgi:hypothetical protein
MAAAAAADCRLRNNPRHQQRYMTTALAKFRRNSLPRRQCDWVGAQICLAGLRPGAYLFTAGNFSKERKKERKKEREREKEKKVEKGMNN